MSRIEINEHVDFTQWLPRAWNEQYTHRLTKGDITQSNGVYQSSLSKLPVDFLLERAVITGDQHAAAFFIIKLRRNINNSLGVDRLIEEYSGEHSDSYHILSPSCTLTYALHGLKPYQLNIVNVVTNTRRADSDRETRPATLNDTRWLSHCCKTLQESLDHVKKNIDELVKLAKNGNQDGGVATSRIYTLPQ